MTRAALLTLAGLLLASAAHAQAPDQAPPPPASDQAPPGAGGPHHGGMGGGMGGMRQACAADMQTFCADAGQERGARRQCMMAHQAQLSPGCKDAMAKMQAWRDSHPRPDGQSPQQPPQ